MSKWGFFGMKKFFLTEGKRLSFSLAVVTVMVSLSLLGGGHLSLLPSFLAGYFLAAMNFAIVTLRLKRAEGKTKAAAKREMLFGMLLRLIMLFVVLGAALKISLNVFMTVIAGFGVFYVVFLAHLIIAVFRLNILSEDEADEAPPLSMVKEV